jgi:hypothetical protein
MKWQKKAVMDRTFAREFQPAQNMTSTRELQSDMFERVQEYCEARDLAEAVGTTYTPSIRFWFSVLGLTVLATSDQVRKAKKARWKAVHPDKCADSRAQAASQLLNSAIEAIAQHIIIDLTADTDSDSDPECRAQPTEPPAQHTPQPTPQPTSQPTSQPTPQPTSQPTQSTAEPDAVDALQQPSHHASSIRPPIHKSEFAVGTMFDSFECVYSRMLLFAQQENFLICKKIEPNKGKGYYSIWCNRGGLPEAKKSPSEAQRDRASLKCGCGFKISLCGAQGKLVVREANLEHSPPCNPSLVQLKVAEQARGRTIDVAVLSSLLDLVRVSATHQQIRQFIHLHNLHLQDDPQSIRNLCFLSCA